MERNYPGVNLQLRKAGPTDLSLLQYWDRQPHVIAAAPNDEWDWEMELNRDPSWRELLIAELDGRPLGFIQIIDPALEDSHYWGETPPDLRAIDIWIGEEKDLGKGYGTVMMHEAIERCFREEGVKAILIDPLESNHGARRFYERLGFRQVGIRHFDEDICMVYQLSRSDWQRLLRERKETGWSQALSRKHSEAERQGGEGAAEV